MNEKYKLEYEKFKENIELGLYDNAIMAISIQFGKLLAFLELSDFTELERDCEEKKISELYDNWQKRYYLKEEK